MTPQEEVDSLPTHPVFGRWILCACGAATCRRVWPSKIGTFHMGTGFEPEEVREIMANMQDVSFWKAPEHRKLLTIWEEEMTKSFILVTFDENGCTWMMKVAK